MANFGSSLHVNQALTTYSVGWKIPADKAGWFARGDFFGKVPVERDSDVVRSVSQGAMLQRYIAAVGVDAKHVPRVEFRIGPDVTFRCVPRVLEGQLNNYDAKRADNALQYEKKQMDMPRFALEMDNEALAMTILLDSANYGNNVTNLASNELFDNYAGSASSIYDEIATRLEKIVLDTGNKVNRFGFALPSWRVIKGHPGLLKRPFFNQAGGVGYRMLLKDFEGLFDEWLEPGACRVYRGVYNNQPAPNDDDPKDLKLFFGPGMVAAYVQDSPSLDDLSFAKEFMFNGLDGVDPMIVLEFEDKSITPIGGTVLRLCTAVDYKVMHKQSAWLWPAVIDKTNAAYNNEAGNSYFV